MTDLNIIKYIDQMCVKNGEIEVSNVKADGNYTVMVPVFNGELGIEQIATLDMEFSYDGEDVTLYNSPKNLLSIEDRDYIMEEIKDFMDKELKNTKQEKVELFYKGLDDWSRPVYQVGNTGEYVKDIECGRFDTPELCWSSPKTDFNGEPDYPFKVEDGVELIIHKKIENIDKNILTQEQINAFKELEKWELNSTSDTFRYMVLDRCRTDCEYYLGNGNRHEKNLWAGSEREHISVMKALWNSFSADNKPQWLSMEGIEEFADKMGVKPTLEEKIQAVETKKEESVNTKTISYPEL